MRILYYSLALYLSLTSPVSAASSKESPEEAHPPCAVRSPFSGNFFDLSALHLLDPATVKSKSKKPRDWSWNTTGWELGYNFTINFCGPVLEDLENVVDVKEELWRNVSAFYKENGKTYSLGLQNDEPVIRGRKLVLNYTNGSPCKSTIPERSEMFADLSEREIIGMDAKKDHDDKHDDEDDDDDDDDDKSKPSKGSGRPPSDGLRTKDGVRRKSAIISFLCDKDPLSPLLSLSYVGSTDECSYFFEARTRAACATVQTSKQTLGPAGVFGVIALIGVLVYLVGGCFYSRAVLQQRGWKQLPNYSFWASIFGFFRDLFVILTSSCTRMMPSRRGYSRVSNGYGGSGERRGRGDSDAENRLIDELNEEWDD